MQKGKNKLLLMILVGLMSLALMVGCPPVPDPDPALPPPMPRVITLTAYPVGSLGTILATAFTDAIETKTGIRARPTPADTDMGRILPVRIGEAQLALVTTGSVYFVSRGLGEFSGKEWGPQRIRIVYSGSPIQHGLAVRGDSGIYTWADLKGKRIALAPGIFTLTVPGFLAYGGLTPADVIMVPAPGYIASLRMVMDGVADAAHAAVPTPLVAEWEAAPFGLRFMPMDPKDKEAWERLHKHAPFMSPVWVDTGAVGIDGPKWLGNYPYIMVTYDFVDEHVIYTIVRAMDEGHDLFKAVRPPDTELWSMELTLDLEKPVDIPFHPGFIRYAKERGMWTPEHEKWQAEALRVEEERIAAWRPK
jgi:TRAP transporter TAXI family solute receptor